MHDPVLLAFTVSVFCTALFVGILICVGGKTAQDTGTLNKEENEK